MKKAYVRLAKGESIPIFAAEEQTVEAPKDAKTEKVVKAPKKATKKEEK